MQEDDTELNDVDKSKKYEKQLQDIKLLQKGIVIFFIQCIEEFKEY